MGILGQRVRRREAIGRQALITPSSVPSVPLWLFLRMVRWPKPAFPCYHITNDNVICAPRACEGITPMKPFLARAALACLLLPAHAQGAEKPSAADILARVRPSVVKLSVVDARKQTSSGSGVFLTADGQILTCYHVIANAKTVVARLADGSTAKVTSVVAFSAAQDWAVVQSDARNAVPAPRGKPSALRQGDRIYTLGAPLGLNLTASDGMVSAIRTIEGVGLYLQITAPISPGSSGGPVLNTDGEVVGITAFYLTKGENLNFAVAISTVEAEWTGNETPRPFAAASAQANGKAPTKAPPPDSTEVARLYAQGAAAIPSDDASKSVKVAACRKALPYFATANRLAPNDPDILFQEAYCHVVLGETAKAIREYRAAIRIKPNDATARNNLGVALGNAGRSKEEITEYRAAIRIKPDSVEGHFNLGLALGTAGRTEEAIAELRAAVRIKPDYAEAHYNLGVALGKAGRTSDAIAEYKTAISTKPAYAEAHYNLGLAYGEAGRTDEAIAEFRAAIHINPQHVEAHYSLGAALGRAGRIDEAIAECRAAIRIKPDSAEALYNLGVTLDAAGRTNEAISEYRASIRAKPGFAVAHLNLGAALGDQGRVEESIAEYRTAIRIEPDCAEAHGNLGMCYSVKGDRARAMKEYGILKSLDKAKAKVLLDFINQVK